MKFKYIYNTILIVLAILFLFVIISPSLNILLLKSICVLFLIKFLFEVLD
jgi:hypothetical protein